MNAASILAVALLVAGVVAAGVIVWKYVKDLHESPRDMWILFGYMVIQYIAYAAMNPVLTLWLSADCGVSDITAGNIIMIWSILLSCIGMVAGALVDTIGVRKVMFLSVIFLFVSRLAMTFITNPVVVFIVGFIPFALGFALVSPVISVSIKRYTTKEGAALGFGLFYVIMNAAYAVGGWLIDFVRDRFAERDAAGKIINENAGVDLAGIHLSSYQMLFLIAVGLTVVGALVIMFIRDGIEVVEETDEKTGKTTSQIIKKPVEQHGSGFQAVKGAAVSMGKKIGGAVKENYFWIFIGILTITLFVRFVFFHLHYTFPKYGIRVLGEGAKIGSIYGVLNPVLIIYLTPLVAAFTRKTKSYKMLVIGSLVSAASCFIAVLPGTMFSFLNDSVLSEIIFIKWLGIAKDMNGLQEFFAQNPLSMQYWSLIFFFIIFTIGESIWSPRLMQFTAEIAPKGKEGTYISLSVLPFFFAKFFVAPLSGWLVSSYVPLDEAGKIASSYPNHHMVWVIIGGMALVTPLGLLILRPFFKKHIKEA